MPDQKMEAIQTMQGESMAFPWIFVAFLLSITILRTSVISPEKFIDDNIDRIAQKSHLTSVGRSIVRRIFSHFC